MIKIMIISILASVIIFPADSMAKSMKPSIFNLGLTPATGGMGGNYQVYADSEYRFSWLFGLQVIPKSGSKQSCWNYSFGFMAYPGNTRKKGAAGESWFAGLIYSPSVNSGRDVSGDNKVIYGVTAPLGYRWNFGSNDEYAISAGVSLGYHEYDDRMKDLLGKDYEFTTNPFITIGLAF